MLLNQSDVKRFSSGFLIDLVSCDVVRLDDAAASMETLYRALVWFVTAIVTTVLLVGFPVISGFLFLVSLVVFIVAAGVVCAKLFRMAVQNTDRRSSMMRAIVCGIRTLKMNAWEGAFEEIIERLRRYESKPELR